MQALLIVAALTPAIQVLLNRKMDRQRTDREAMKTEILEKIDDFETRNSSRLDHLDDCVDRVRERVATIEGQLSVAERRGWGNGNGSVSRAQ